MSESEDMKSPSRKLSLLTAAPEYIEPKEGVTPGAPEKCPYPGCKTVYSGLKSYKLHVQFYHSGTFQCNSCQAILHRKYGHSCSNKKKGSHNASNNSKKSYKRERKTVESNSEDDDDEVHRNASNNSKKSDKRKRRTIESSSEDDDDDVFDISDDDKKPQVLPSVTSKRGTKLGDGEWTAPKDNASISGQYSVLNPNKKTLEKKVEATAAAGTDDAAETKGYAGVIDALKRLNKEPLLALFKANGYDDDFVKVLSIANSVDMKLLSCVGIEKSGERFKLIKFVQNFHAAEEPKTKRFKKEKKEKENSSRNVDKKIKKER